MGSKIDLHMHTTYSDGTDNLETLYLNLKKAGIHTFAISDHDTIDGAVKMSEIIDESMVYYKAVEFSCRSEIKKCHILGYDYDANNQAFIDLIEKGNMLRVGNLNKRLAYLKEKYSFLFSQEEREYLYSLPAAGKPHIARLLMKHGIVQSIEEAFVKYLKHMHIPSYKVDAKEAIATIRAAGGIAVWAHPLGGESDPHDQGESFEAQFRYLYDAGIQGLECYYSRYSREEVDFLLKRAKAHHLLISGGSDYHGKNKTIALGTLNDEDYEVYEEQLTLLSALKRKNEI